MGQGRILAEDQKKPHPVSGPKNFGQSAPGEVKQQPRIDQVYLYEGDLNADGKKESGVVNFYRDRSFPSHPPSKFNSFRSILDLAYMIHDVWFRY